MNANPVHNDPSAVSKLSYQGEKRKRDSEQVQPSMENSGLLTGSVTRQRIVEILSHTTNGCLSELGYYPGMAGKLKEMEAQNLKWRDENVKLYQDNQRLTQMVQTLNTNAALSGIPESDKVAKILQLQNEIRRLQVENEHARKLMHLPQELENLTEKYNQLLHSRQLIVKENQHLKSYIQGLGVPSLQILQQQQQQISQSSTINPNARLHHKDQHPQLQAQAPHSSSSRPSSAQSLQRGQTQVLENEVAQTQFAVAQHRRLPHSNPSSRRTSLNLVSPTVQSPQVPSQPFGANISSNSRPQIQAHVLDASQQHMLLYGPNVHHNMRRASAPNTPVLHGNSYPSIHSHPMDVGQMQPAGSSQASQVMPPSNYSPNGPAGSPFFGPAPSGSPAHVLQSHGTSQMQKGMEPIHTSSISPRDNYVHTSSMMQTSPSSLVSPQPLVGQNAPPPAVRPANAMFIPSSSASAALPKSDISMAPSDSRFSSTSEAPPQSGVNDAFSTEQSKPDGTISESVDNIAAPRETSDASEGDAMQVDTVEKENVGQVDMVEKGGEGGGGGGGGGGDDDDDDDDDEEEEEDLELGPDGLRLVKDCLVHIFGSPVEGRVICKLCQHRFKTGFQDRPPSPFINATDIELEKHCIEEHQKPWEALRKP